MFTVDEIPFKNVFYSAEWWWRIWDAMDSVAKELGIRRVTLADEYQIEATNAVPRSVLTCTVPNRIVLCYTSKTMVVGQWDVGSRRYIMAIPRYYSRGNRLIPYKIDREADRFLTLLERARPGIAQVEIDGRVSFYGERLGELHSKPTKGKTVTLYRVEHKKSGLGPYRHPGVSSDVYDLLARHTFLSGHPPPQSEGGPFFGSTTLRWCSLWDGAWRCAMSSVEQLCKWFSAQERRAMAREDFVMVEVEVSVKYAEVAPSQAIFSPTHVVRRKVTDLPLD